MLDVAAGTGEHTLLAARRVRANGSALATDIATRMLAGAAEAAPARGTRQRRDASPGCPQPRPRAGVRSTPPGRELAALVLRTAEENPFIAFPLEIAGRRTGTPLVQFDDPGMFALGDLAVLQAAYERAGFRELAVEEVSVQRRFASLAVAMQNCRDILPEVSQLMVYLSENTIIGQWKTCLRVTGRV